MTTQPVYSTGTLNVTDSNVSGKLDVNTELDVTGATITGLSHTSLTDIGTNTHPQLDTHVGSTLNPHAVTLEQAAAATGITGLSKGDILVYGGSSAFIRLAAGINGEVLKVNSATVSGLEWGADSSGWTELTVQTTNATPTIISSITTTTNTSYTYREIFTAICVVTGTHAAAGWETDSEWLNDGGTLTKIADQNTAMIHPDASTWTRSLSVSGTNIVSTVTGGPAQTVEWKVAYTYVSHTP